jgi:hypothetical protein
MVKKPIPLGEKDIPKGWKELVDICRRKLNYLESFEDARLWLWKHTESPEQYEAIVNTLRFLANLKFVEWKYVPEE